MPLADTPRNDVTDVHARLLPADCAVSARTSGAQSTPLTQPGTPASPPAAGTARPSATFMRAHPAHMIALGLGAGLSPVAAGTVGTLCAWLAWSLLLTGLSAATQGAVIALALMLSVWASSVTARHLRTADPGAIVIDEVVAFWIVLWLWTPAGFWAQLAAFVLFRFFDAAKPGPVRWADRLLHGAQGWRCGFGIVLDDLVAAFCTLLALALWVRW